MDGTQCEFRTILEWASVVFALLAALFWFASTWSGRMSFRRMSPEKVDEVLRKQNRNNKFAAVSAFFSAADQLTALYLPVCRDFG
jgi:hypothetical protein